MANFILITFLSVLFPANDSLLTPAVATALKDAVPVERLASPVSTVYANEIKAGGLWRQTALADRIPSLHIPEYGASLTSTIYVRGLGSRMENPAIALYLDGIPVLDKNAYDFDWTGVHSALFLRGPQGTLYGRNSMGGVLSLRTLSPSAGERLDAFLEYGSANSVRAGMSLVRGRHAVSAVFRHTDGFFTNTYKNATCDPYDGLSVNWKWEKTSADGLEMSNIFSASVSKEGGFAYAYYDGSDLHPVNYNDEGSYARLRILEGLKISKINDICRMDAVASLQLLADDMRMDQDYTADKIFTLQQRQFSPAMTVEATWRRADASALWQPLTGVSAFFRRNSMHAPVIFKEDGIQRLILDNANANIPESIGYLSISDRTMPVVSDFIIYSWEAALFHESVFRLDRWQFTAGLRLGYEGGLMDYDCTAALHYRFVPTMAAYKEYKLPYSGSLGHSCFQVLPKFSVLYEASDGLYIYGNVSKGYRAGGFNTQIFSDILQNKMMNGLIKDLGVHLNLPAGSVGASNTEYDPEIAWNYELGIRLRKREVRAELSAYRIDVRDRQITVFPPGMSTGRMMANADPGTSRGIEAEFGWQRRRFSTTAAYSYCDARFAYIPDHNMSLTAGYNFNLKSFDLGLNASLLGVGPVRWDEEGTLSEPFRMRANAQVSLNFGKWELYFRGENLTDTKIRAFYFKSMRNEFFALARPRMIISGINVKL